MKKSVLHGGIYISFIQPQHVSQHCHFDGSPTHCMHVLEPASHVGQIATHVPHFPPGPGAGGDGGGDGGDGPGPGKMGHCHFDGSSTHGMHVLEPPLHLGQVATHVPHFPPGPGAGGDGPGAGDGPGEGPGPDPLQKLLAVSSYLL